LIKVPRGNIRKSIEADAANPEAIVLSKKTAHAPLDFLTGAQALGRPGVAAYMRALEAVSQKNDAAATQYFREALEQNPANSFAGQSLVQLYFAERMYSPIADLYRKFGIAAFKSSPITLAQIALSFRQNGDAEQARGVISAALGLFPGNATLSALQNRAQ
jgi:tetratricopeptide (TPR) repeat protein